MTPAQIFVFLPWFLILAAFGYGLTKLKHSRPRTGKMSMRNLGAARIFQGMLLVMGLTLGALAIYAVGGCDGGFKNAATCTSIPNELGSFMFQLYSGNMVLGLFGIPVAAVLAVVVNFLTKPMSEPGADSSLGDEAPKR